MKRFAFIVLAFVLACGIFYSISLLLKPKPIPIMKPTKFERPEQIGAVVYHRLFEKMQRAPLMILGSSPWVRDYEKIWSGLLLTAYSRKKFPKILYQDRDLRAPIAIQGMEVKDLDWEGEILENRLPREIHLVHTVFSQSSQFFDDSYVKRKQFKPGTEPLTITLLPFAVSDAELAQIQPSCPMEKVAETDLERIGCVIKRVSRNYYLKKLDPTQLWALMEQYGARDYILFVHEPNPEYENQEY